MGILCGPWNPTRAPRGWSSCVDPVHQVSRDPRRYTSYAGCVPTSAGMEVLCGQSRGGRGGRVRASPATAPGRADGWSECSQLYMDLPPRYRLFRRPPRSAGGPLPPAARALTVLDDRDVDRRGAGHRQVRLLRGHGRGTLETPAHSRQASEPAPQQALPLAHEVPAVRTTSNQWR